MALRGIKVIELAGLAPAPFCGMILRDHGASVIKIDKPNSVSLDSMSRGKRSLILDLRKPKAAAILSRLCSNADVLINPYRPDALEKYGLGSAQLCKDNPQLIYAHLTGYGLNGPYSKMAGHDINYVAVSGVLSTLGKDDEVPFPPINLLADMAGGGLMCALGICMALLERQKSGKGQIIDSNMVEGTAYLSSFLWSTRDPEFNIPLWSNSRGNNILDGGAHFYQTYQTKDNKYVAVGALEPEFFDALLKGLKLSEHQYPQFGDWDNYKKKLAEIFASKTQEEWCKIFEFTDACVTPVVPLENAHEHCHNDANKSFVHDGKKYVPNVAPKFSRTPGNVSMKNPVPGEHTVEILLEEGYKKNEVEALLKEKIVYSTKRLSSL